MCELCHCDDYTLPEMEIIYHEVSVDHTKAFSYERDGQQRMFRNALLGVTDAAREKRDTLPERLECMRRIIAAEPDEHFLIWHDLEKEREAIEDLFKEEVIDDVKRTASQCHEQAAGTGNLGGGARPAAIQRRYASAFGSQDIDEREKNMADFADGRLQYLGGKPVQIGSGGNYQRHCARAVFLGIGFKFAEFIQAIHRICRYLQPRPVKVHIIYAESERKVLEILLGKWAR